ncbi:MAG: tyrosine-type recombinase/integrase [Clostridia bacterium]|nr:tyrosine-type recombinase/integrase [Clostridia bacterium]
MYVVKHLKNRCFRHLRLHDMLNSCTTPMRNEGIKKEDIQKWLGHSQLATTKKIYVHFEEEQLIALA